MLRVSESKISKNKGNFKLNELLQDFNIIKVGTVNNTSFGRIYCLIDPNNQYPDSLIDLVRKLNGVLVFYGFVLDFFENFVEILDHLNSEVTVLTEYPIEDYEYYSRVLGEFYDVILRVQKDDVGSCIHIEPRIPVCEEKSIHLDFFKIQRLSF